MRHVLLVAVLAAAGCGGGTKLEGDAPDGRDGDGFVGDHGDGAADADGDADADADAEADADVAEDAGPVCGNGVVESGEECDLLNLHETCVTLGYHAGTLRCNATCHFDTSWCRNPTCGDGTCELGETATGCPADCHDGCGDASCAEAEDQFGCPADCGAIEVAVGGSFACVLVADRTVRCWGGNNSGQLGDGTLADSGLPVVVVGLSAVTTVSAGRWHACAVLADTTAQCWGENEHGQLGDGTTASSNMPVPVAGLTGVVAISSGGAPLLSSCPVDPPPPPGGSHSCALLADGSATCWGGNTNCELGDGNYFDETTPVSVEGLSGAVAVSAPHGRSCAVLADGGLRSWGSDMSPVTCRLHEPPGEFFSGVTGISNDCGCVVRFDRTSNCWPGATDVIAIRAGPGHKCALLSEGAVSCWGSNGRGELGDGALVDRAGPAPVVGIASAVGLSAGGQVLRAWGCPGDFGWVYGQSCAVLFDGSAWCWGANDDGQLGDGTTTNSNVPVQVAAW